MASKMDLKLSLIVCWNTTETYRHSWMKGLRSNVHLCLFVYFPKLVPHAKVLEHVSSVLKDFGYYPTGEGIDVGNLRPYDCKMFDRESHAIEHADATKAVKVIDPAARGKVARKRKHSGWDPKYTRRMFFLYWRSVLLDRRLVKIYPYYAPAPAVSGFDPKVLLKSGGDSMGNGSSTNLNNNIKLLIRTQEPESNQPRRLFASAAFTGYGSSRNTNHNIGLLERIRKPTDNHQTRRLLSSSAFTLLKLLKNA